MQGFLLGIWLDGRVLVAYATNMPPSDYIEPLLELGFTEIEARVYGFLVEDSPATGYRISHAIGKQPPNTYKAIASLEAKGAILVEKGETKQCRAVPPEELLENLERRFRSQRALAGERLATQPWHIRGDYRKLLAEFIDYYKRECLSNRIDYVLIDTTEDFDRVLLHYLIKRKRIGG